MQEGSLLTKGIFLPRLPHSLASPNAHDRPGRHAPDPREPAYSDLGPAIPAAGLPTL